MRALPPVLAIALSVAATATADPLGRERLKEVLAEHGQAEPLVVMAELAKQGNLTIDRSDAIAGAISAPVSPAVRTWLGNTQRIRTQDGRLLLKADQGFRVPTQNGAQLEFGDRFRLDLEPDGRVSTRGLGVRPPKAIHTGPVKGALLDSKGIYGLDLGKPGSRERVVQLRPKAPTPVEELGEKIVEKSMDVLRDQHRRMLDDMVREPRRDADPETPAPTQAAPRASMPRAQVADAAPASAPRVERPAAAVDPAEVTLADPASGATEGGEDKLRKLFGLEGGGDAAFRPIGPGSEGVAVRDLQRRLQVAGQPLEVDGKFGPGTADALKQFQRDHGLSPSGQLDAETHAALARAARAPRVARGDQGAAARRLQEGLRRRGARLRPDGVFGPKSAEALKRFQRENGLEATGVADAATWDALDTLRRGDKGDQVRELQEALNRFRAAQGKPKLAVDGKFGPGTEAAIKELQGELGVEQDGRVSPELLDSLRRAKLQGIVTQAEKAERKSAPAVGLAEGDRGADVKALQQELRRHGIALNPDGHFGPATRKALERFQRDNGLPVTGRADEETRNALRGLVRGDQGEDVKDLQRLINHQRRIAGLDELPIDGKYGAGTAEAIAEIQRGLERQPTGRADKPLIDALTTARDQDTQPILRPGDQGKSVSRLQERLNAHREAAGLAKIRETGHFDKDTKTALATFQRGNDLPASGESDKATWDQLDGQPPADVKARPLREGDEHDEVALLQDKLNQVRRWRGERPIGVDGNFGPGTRKAIEGFQQQSDLPVTGRADAETVAALDEATAGSFSGNFPKQAQYKPFSAEARQLFTAAARLAGVPEEWAHSNGLHQILSRESKGWVGVPNYTYGRRKTNRASWASVHEELRRGRKRAKSSATGLGQLLLGNVDKYYPQGRAGIGDPLNEAAGMLAYIKARYGTPARAWKLYGKLHEGY